MSKVTYSALFVLLIFVTGISASEIHTAAEEGNFNTVKDILKNSPQLLDEKNERGSTPLLIAAYN